VGNIVYGYRLSSNGTHLEADETEQAAVVRITTLRWAGKTLRDIARDLNERGHRTRRGSEWRLSI
jgi:site-specific DNA recombinase